MDVPNASPLNADASRGAFEACRVGDTNSQTLAVYSSDTSFLVVPPLPPCWVEMAVSEDSRRFQAVFCRAH